MKKFKNGDSIDCYTLEEAEIIKFENHYLKVVFDTDDEEEDTCDKCFFDNNKHSCKHLDVSCISSNKNIRVSYIEISEIETLILTKSDNLL